MMNKLFVGNLPHEMTENELQELFAAVGPVVSAKIITDRMTGLPRGFGFVEMETKGDAQRAISTLNGKEVQGRTLAVNEARPQQKRGHSHASAFCAPRRIACRAGRCYHARH